MDTLSVGFDLSLKTVDRLVELQARLGPAILAAGAEPRWTPATEIRVPLKAIRGVDPEFTPFLYDALTEVAGALVPFRVAVDAVECFPSPTVPRLVHARLGRGADLVEGLRSVLEVHLDRLGIGADRRPFMATALLGRIRTSTRVDLTDVLAADAPRGDSLVRSLVLFRHRPDQPAEVLKRFRLGASPG